MRFAILLLLNLPIIGLALVKIITQFKLGKVSPARLRHQLTIWGILLVTLVSSFPVYNLLVGRPAFDSTELSAFDIVQTTAIILLFYIINNQRQKNQQIEQRLQSLHQELSIRISKNK